MSGNDAVPPSWREALDPVLATPEARRLGGFLKAEEAAGKAVYPPRGVRLAALDLTPLDTVKVVILGQDPYHGPGQAHGLSFSVQPGVRVPPSLVNIYKELHTDLGLPIPKHGNLTRWAEQGVLLLNTALTVREGASKAGSHLSLGWGAVTDAVIAAVSRQRPHVVFLLWGNPAQTKRPLIDESRHLVIASAHPSPLSARRGFFGSKPFSRANVWLEERGEKPIAW